MARRNRLDHLSLTPDAAARFGLHINRDGVRRSAFALLSLPGIDMTALQRIWPDLAEIEPAIARQIETDAHYAVYLDRQAADIAAFRRDESLALPDELDYAGLPGLSTEIRTRLATVRPRTMGQAARIEGVTPVALTLLAAHVRRAEA